MNTTKEEDNRIGITGIGTTCSRCGRLGVIVVQVNGKQVCTGCWK